MAGRRRACELRDMHIRLAEFRKKLGLTLEQMAERTEFSVSQLSRWESGKNNIPSERLPEIAAAYECRISQIFSDDDDTYLPAGPTLFIKGNVQAGHFAEAWEVSEDDWERYTGRADISTPVRERFGLKVVGDSMNEVYLPGTVLDCIAYAGDYQIPNGKRVIVRRRRFGGGAETTAKEYFRDTDGVEWLVPRSNNPAFQAPFRVDEPGTDIEEISIVAVVVASIQPE
jgi:transcriptional regulator with XRE-family HTH domain